MCVLWPVQSWPPTDCILATDIVLPQSSLQAAWQTDEGQSLSVCSPQTATMSKTTNPGSWHVRRPWAHRPLWTWQKQIQSHWPDVPTLAPSKDGAIIKWGDMSRSDSLRTEPAGTANSNTRQKLPVHHHQEVQIRNHYSDTTTYSFKW